MNIKLEKYPEWYVPVGIAKKLKSIGFDSKTTSYYSFDRECPGYFTSRNPENHNTPRYEAGLYVSLPTWEQVFDWFRKKKYLCALSCSNMIFPIEMADEYNNTVFRGEVCWNVTLYKSLKGKVCRGSDRLMMEHCHRLYQETFESYRKARKTAVLKLIERYKEIGDGEPT